MQPHLTCFYVRCLFLNVIPCSLTNFCSHLKVILCFHVKISIPVHTTIQPAFLYAQGSRKHLKFGGRATLQGHFFLKKCGAFSQTERALLCLLQNLGGTCTPVPPGSYVYVYGALLRASLRKPLPLKLPVVFMAI